MFPYYRVAPKAIVARMTRIMTLHYLEINARMMRLEKLTMIILNMEKLQVIWRMCLQNDKHRNGDKDEDENSNHDRMKKCQERKDSMDDQDYSVDEDFIKDEKFEN